MSSTKSPPKKKTNIDITNSRDNMIEALEIKNNKLSEAVEQKQEQLTKQANFINVLKGDLDKVNTAVSEKSDETEKYKKLYDDLIKESQKVPVDRGMEKEEEDKENEERRKEFKT